MKENSNYNKLHLDWIILTLTWKKIVTQFSFILIVALPPNAFLEPDNPEAVIPKIAKPNIQDYRSHKIEMGGYAAVGTFRKTY